MPRRTSLRDRVNALPTPRGREAIYGERDPSVEPSSRWEAGHKRVTFYCSIELLEALEAEMVRGRRTKTQVIVHALTDHLGRTSEPTRAETPGRVQT